MTVEFHTLFDGPGIGDRLSLADFGTPLGLLLSALQRTASGILSAALERPEYGGRGGKFAAGARLLDLEMESVHGNCVEPRFVCTARVPSGGQIPLVEDLPAQAVERLTRDIEAEAKGLRRSAAARRFLESLPAGITRQRYVAMSGGQVLYTAEFGSATLAATPPMLGHLVRRRARVVGVGFDPTSVRLKFLGRTATFQTDTAGVEAALQHRHSEVIVAVIEDVDSPRLVWLHPFDALPEVPALDKTVAHLKESWADTLRILAQ